MQRYRSAKHPGDERTRRQLQGVITSNSLVEVAEQEATEDMFRLFGVGGNLATGL